MKALVSTNTATSAPGMVHAGSPELLCTKGFDQWDALPAGYQALFEEGRAQSLFLSRPWFANLVENSLNPGEKVRILAVENLAHSGNPLLVLPASHRSTAAWKPRTLTSLTNFYTPLYAPLIQPNCDARRVLQTLAQALSAESPAWDMINLRWLDKSSSLFEDLVTALQLAGFVVQTYFCAGNWYEPVGGRTYQEYLQDLRSSVRNIARSKQKKVDRSGRVRAEIVTGGELLGAAIQAYEQVYASSWKTNEPYPRFIPGLLQVFAAEGWLRLGLAYVDEVPAAAQVWFVANGVASIYKIAYDQRFKDLSLGSYLTMHMIQRAIEVEKVQEVDYLTGDDRYKQDWMSLRRERWGILAMNPRTVKGVAAIVRHVGGRAVKRTAQQILGRLRPEKTRQKIVPVTAGSVSSKEQG